MGKKDLIGEIDSMIDALKDNNDDVEEVSDVDNTDDVDDVDDTDVDDIEEESDESDDSDDDVTDSDDDDDDVDVNQSGIIDLMRSVINDMVSITKTDSTKTESTKDEIPDITDEEIETAMQSPENFKKVLTTYEQRVMKRMINEVLPSMYENILGQIQIQNAVNEFYNNNPDLKPYKELVAYITKAIAEEHQDWPIDKVLSTSAKIARQKLLLTGKTDKKGKYKTKPPASKKGKQKLSSMEKEILDLIS